MITNWLKMKKQEILFKLTFYTYVNNFINSKTEILDLAYKIFVSLKDEPVEEMKEKFIDSLADAIHETTSKAN